MPNDDLDRLVSDGGVVYAYGSAMSESRTDAYGYNARGEITSAMKQGVQTPSSTVLEHAYQYDDIGNRLTSMDIGCSRAYTSNGLNQYTDVAESPSANAPQGAVEEFEPLYDDDGNQTLVKTATGVWSVLYNGENRPVLWTRASDGATVSMAFDRMGRRVRCHETGGTAAGSVMTFAYDGYVCVARRRHGTGGAFDVDRFVWDPAEPVATRPLVFCVADSAPQYYAHDGSKNVSELVSADGAASAHYEYAPFGAVTYSAGSSAVSNPYRFSSEYADSSLALVYYNYRHYEPVTGRWLSRDPIEERGGVGLYLLCENGRKRFDIGGLLSIRDIVYGYANFGGSKELWRQPLGPGFVVLDMFLGVSIKYCCDRAVRKRMAWVFGEIELELYYQLGFHKGTSRESLKEKKFKGRDRNKRLPHPCRPGKLIKLKRYNAEVEKCRREERNPKSTKLSGDVASSIGCEYCPSPRIDVDGGFFVRAVVGLGFGLGVTARGDYKVKLDDPLSWKNLKGAVSIGSAGKGVSIDVGGVVTVDFAIKKIR